MAGQYGEISGATAVSEPETSPVFGWKGFARFWGPTARQFRDFSRQGGEADQLYNQYKDQYLAGSAQAADNAQIYRDYATSLFQNQPNQFNDYQQMGNYLFGQLNNFRDASASAGLRDMNSRLAGLGIRPGSTGYDRLLNATRITNNLVPAYQSTIGALGRDFGTLSGNQFRDTLLRLGMAQDDVLGGYTDRVAERPLDVAANRLGLLSSFNDQYRQILDNFNRNIAGYKTEEGSDLAKYGAVFDRWASSYGGGSSAPYQQGPQNPYLNQMNNPYSMPQGGYPVYGNTGGAMPAAQNQQWMNEFNGGAPMGQTGYLGDVNVNPYLAGAV